LTIGKEGVFFALPLDTAFDLVITSATLLVLRLLGEVTGLDNGTTYERWEDGWMSNRGFSASMKSHAYGRFDMIRRGEAVEGPFPWLMPFIALQYLRMHWEAEILSDIRCIPVTISLPPHGPNHKSLNEHITSLYLSGLGQNDRESPNKVFKGPTHALLLHVRPNLM